ncbi:PKD domain-containing protein [Thermus tengchongensis]|uniref:PKD domain-containing protein n=1 Tax=Thermus tengchongensis TaxID=1214928 RepID=UPI000A0025D3|nr:PKD domain-containing protein [Thermus tengchongensis]
MARIASLLALALVLLASCEWTALNRPPRLLAFQASPLEGEAPLTVRFTWQAEDPDGDPLTCVLELGDGTKLTLAPCGSGTTYTYSRPGDYPARLQVQDPKEATTQSQNPVVVRVRPGGSFTLSLSPTSLSVEQGGSGTTTLTLTPQNGFTGQVTLSLERQDGTPAPSSLTLSPTSLSVAGTGPVSQILNLNVGSSTPTGTYPLRVRATSGSLSRTANLSLTVTTLPPPPDFALSLNPSSLNAPQGGSTTTQLTLTPQNGFTGTVSLSLVGAPSGVNLSPASLSVSSSTPVTQNLTLSVGSSVPPSTYPLKVRATGGGISREADLTLTVAQPSGEDFSLTLEDSSLSVAQGGTAYVRLVVSGTYTGQVTLSLVDASKNPFSGVSLSPTSTPVPSAPMLELTASPTLAPGTYSLFVRGQGGSLVREAPLTLTVTAPSSLPNLRLTKAEWGQTVLKESLRLVAGKPALLRVHLLASPSPITLSNALSGAVYLNSAFQGNLSFTCPNPIPTATDPGDLANTCTATLPAEWVAPGLRVELRADPQDQVAETDEADNLLTLTPSVGAGTTLHLTAVPVVHGGHTATVPSFGQTLWRIWPLKEVASSTRAPYTFSGTLSASDGNTWAQLLQELLLLRQQDGSERYYYGFVRVSYTSGIAGIGYLGYPVAVGWDYPSSAPAVMAHELGHNFGQEHAPCGVSGDPNYPYAGGKIGTWGYDLANSSLKDPSQLYDLMSYCNPQWISDYTYEGAQAFLEKYPPKPLALPQEGLLFTGRIQNGQVVLNPPLRLKAAPEGELSPYRLLAEVPGQPSPLEVPVYTLLDSEGILHFQALLPVGTYAKVGLYLGANLLKAVSAPLVPLAEPQVSLAEEGGFLRVRVQGYPFFSLFHVAEDGSRTTLGLWHRAGEVPFALEGLPPGGEWEVQVSDGLEVRILRFAR